MIFPRQRLYSNRINSCAFFFTETWMNQIIPAAAIELAGRTVYRADRTADSIKDKGGGVCIYVCNLWCTTTDIVETFCSPDLEFMTVTCRPREYIPPQANTKLALASLHDAIHQLKNNHPDGVFIIETRTTPWTRSTATLLQAIKGPLPQSGPIRSHQSALNTCIQTPHCKVQTNSLHHHALARRSNGQATELL